VDDHEFWDEFYEGQNAVGYPSPFAEFCESHFLDDTSLILELGSGNGRDAFFFYDRGHQVVAFDQSHSAFEHCQRRAAEVKYPERVRFVNHDFTRIDPAGYPDVDAVYSRFTLHSVDAEAEARVLDVAWRLLGPGGQLLLEARTVNDPLYGKGTEVGRHEFITDHYRRHIDAQELLTSVLERGFLLHFFHESDGLAVYQDEDPVVVRMALLRP